MAVNQSFLLDPLDRRTAAIAVVFIEHELFSPYPHKLQLKLSVSQFGIAGKQNNENGLRHFQID
jgi:hypothetical protein